MADHIFEEGEVMVRNVRAVEDERERKHGVAGSIVGLGKNIFRLGKSVVSLGVGMIPKETATHLQNGLRESVYAATSLPRDIVDVVGEKAEKFRQKHEKKHQASRDEVIEIK